MPSSETILNRSLHVSLCFFLSDDLNYLIITIGYLHWKMNCFRHRRNFSPSCCSESCPCSGSTEQTAPGSWGPAAAGLCTWLRAPARLSRGEIHCCWCACGCCGQDGEPGSSQVSLPRCFPSDAESAISTSIQQGHLRSFYQMYDIIWPHLEQDQAQLEVESQGKHVEIQLFPSVLQA